MRLRDTACGSSQVAESWSSLEKLETERRVHFITTICGCPREDFENLRFFVFYKSDNWKYLMNRG